MKPRCLTLQAFGPFARREVIDFTKLPSDALFLIHGPTGAGKSTLLDGICYALYGTTSGGERQPREMRSHHAADTLQTEVELDFELGAKRFRIKRIPEQERTATTGVARPVKVASKAELYQWSGTEWKLLAAKAGEVADHVVKELGFEADQFRQVIMLPQGQFRKLLSADSRDREKILEALFSTEKFKRLQERLQASARQLEESAKAAESRRTTLLQQAEVDSAEALIQRIAEANQALATLASTAEQCRQQSEAAQQALSAGEALAAKFKERDTAQAGLEHLHAADASIAADRQRHDNALRAQNVIPAWNSLNDSREQHKNAAIKVAQANTEANQAAQASTIAAQQLAQEESKAPEREAAAREISRLEESRAAVVRLNEADVSRQAAARESKATTAAADKLDQTCKSLAAQRQAFNQQIESLTPLATRTEALKLAVAQQEQQLKTLRQIEVSAAAVQKLGKETHKHQTALATVRAAHDQARQTAADLDAKWRAGQAAVLATCLTDGGPCPVCGSQAHPHPASGDTDIPSAEQMQAAAEQVTQTEAAVDKARQTEQTGAQKLAAAEATLKAQREALAGETLTIASVETAVTAQRAACEEALNAQVTLTKVRTALAGCEQQLEAAHKSLETARVAAAEATAKSVAAESTWAERASQVPENLRDPAALETLLAQARATQEALGQSFKRAQEAHQTAQSQQAATAATLKTRQEAAAESQLRLQTAQEAFLAALAQHGFVDEPAFTAAKLAPEAITALAQRIRQHDQALAAAQERLTRAAAAVTGLSSPNLDALLESRKAAQDKLEAVLKEQNTLQAKNVERARTAEMLEEIRRELGDISKRYQVMGHLAEIANGRNTNISFQRYVLAALLDNVLIQASQRLRKMTSNRYTLQRFKDVSDKRRAAGLDIEVFDEQTGSARSANTLSGGEGFMASLSLALGLSDVVQSYAGGIQLDTLFIDEGFGTLDPESLDMAMKALIELQQKGRLVGIISHVDELKQQLEHGIEIRFAPGGSSARVGAIAG